MNNTPKLPISDFEFKINDRKYNIALVVDTCGPVRAFPGSGPPEDNIEEFASFTHLIHLISNKQNPCMVELGCHWAMSSLLFRNIYPDGKNILLEPDLCNLSIGRMNFHLNNFDCDSVWGSVFPGDPSTDPLDSGFVPDLNPRSRPIDFTEGVYKKFKLQNIDVLHMDIQGSEFPLIKYLHESNYLNKIVKSTFIATHNIKEHHEIVDILKSNDFKIVLNEERTRIHQDKAVFRKYLPEFKDEAYEFAEEVNGEVQVQEDGYFLIAYREPQLTDGLIAAYKI
jgi:hypothetical protein